MSISTLQEKLLNKGCGSAFIVIATVALGVTFLTGQCNTASRMDQRAQEAGGGDIIASVGEVPVTAQLIEAQASRMGGGDASMQSMGLAFATGAVLKSAAVRSLLDKGSAVTDAEVAKAAALKVVEIRSQLRQQLKLKPTATDAELGAAYKAAAGGVPPTAELFTTAFKDAARKSAVLDDLGPAILAARAGAKLYSTDEALKDSFKTYVVRRVFFSAQSGAKETPDARAAKALADLKAGTSFGKLMDTMSNDPPGPKGKQPHEMTDRVSDGFAAQPYLAELKDKPANATTGVTDVPGGKAIYQLVAVQNDVPPDFAKNADSLRASKGQAEVNRQVEALLASKDVTWKDEGFHALNLYAQAAPYGFVSDPAAAKRAFDAGQAALKSDNESTRRRGAMAMLLASAPSMVSTQGAAKPPITPDRLAALEAAKTAGLADPSLSLDLARAYGERKDGAKAVEALIAASRGNTRYDATGQNTFRDVASEATKLQAAKVITDEQLKSVQAEQAQWRAARDENEKANAAAQKANEEEIKRQQAEAAKSKPASGAPNGGATVGVPGIKAEASTGAPATGAPKPMTGTTGGSLLPTTAGAKP